MSPQRNVDLRRCSSLKRGSASMADQSRDCVDMEVLLLVSAAGCVPASVACTTLPGDTFAKLSPRRATVPGKRRSDRGRILVLFFALHHRENPKADGIISAPVARGQKS